MTKTGVTSGLGQSSVHAVNSSESPFRSQSASQSSAFRSALNEFQPRRNDCSDIGKNCLNGPSKPATTTSNQRNQASEVKRLRATVMDVLSKGGLDNIASSALMKVASAASQSENLKSYSLKGIGSISGGGGSVSLHGNSGSNCLPRTQGAGDLGSVAAKFESGEAGIDAIGYDENGGTSYGTYQISSRQGTMTRFINYLRERAPEWATALKSAGSTNTGSRTGGVPEAWKSISAKDPERFAQLQHDFIEESHYIPALQEVEQRTSVDVGERSEALREALWSTAVQHGPGRAAKIFSKAIESSQARGGNLSDTEIIQKVYAMRENDFGSSTERVQSAVRDRFKEEKSVLLAMLQDKTRSSRVSSRSIS